MNRTAWHKIGWIAAAVLLLNVAWFVYVHQEHTLYCWDFDNYWGICSQFRHDFVTRAHVEFAREVRESIRNEDYTVEPVLPAVFSIALGEKLHLFSFSRVAYIIANGNFYLVPALLLLIWLVSILQSDKFSLDINAIQLAVWFAGALIALLTPALWLPLLHGFPDGGGLVFCFLVMVLFVRWHLRESSKMGDTIAWLAIAVLLVGLAYFRRWYLYWILWFWIAAGMLCLWDAFERWRNGLSALSLFRRVAVFSGAFFVFAALMFVVSPHFVHKLVWDNLSDQYVAFRYSETFSQFLANTFLFHGVAFILLFLGGLAYGLLTPHLRKLVVFQTVQFVGSVAHFGHTQDLGQHHRYLLLASMLPWATLFVAFGLQRFRWRFAACVIPVGILATTLSFVPLPFAVPAVIRFSIGVVDGAPITRPDLAEWRRFGKAMDEILLSHGDGRVYVLGASTTINSSALISLDRSLGEKFRAPGFVDPTCDVDKRDGFPVPLLHAKYVVVASPVQTHLDPAEQRIVTVPEREFLEGTGIAAAFEKLPYQFELDAGVNYSLGSRVIVNKAPNPVEIYVFQKIRNITRQEAEHLSDALREAHPSRPSIYMLPADIN